MKKRMVFVMMVFVLIGLSVAALPISAEPLDTEVLGVVEAGEAVSASTNGFTLSQTKNLWVWELRQH